LYSRLTIEENLWTFMLYKDTKLWIFTWYDDMNLHKNPEHSIFHAKRLAVDNLELRNGLLQYTSFRYSTYAYITFKTG
jgi:hypothetical protein